MAKNMTHATIHYIDSGTMAVEFDYHKDLKDTIAAMTGAEWQKKDKRWLLPVARLGDVVKLFWPNVTIDYDVLRARDEQLRRMFRQYRAMGIRFQIVAGKVQCNHDVLNGWFAKHGTILHMQALEVVLVEKAIKALAKPEVQASQPAADPKLELWLRGAKNAVIADEKKQAMIASIKRKRVA